jgi:hypothetical protein
MGLALAVHVKGFGFWLRCGEQTLKFGAPLALEQICGCFFLIPRVNHIRADAGFKCL